MPPLNREAGMDKTDRDWSTALGGPPSACVCMCVRACVCVCVCTCARVPGRTNQPQTTSVGDKTERVQGIATDSFGWGSVGVRGHGVVRSVRPSPACSAVQYVKHVPKARPGDSKLPPLASVIKALPRIGVWVSIVGLNGRGEDAMRRVE